jgi:hypothetical protein
MALFALFFLTGGAGCNRDNPYEEIKIKDFSYQGCKEIVTNYTKASEREEYIEYKAEVRRIPGVEPLSVLRGFELGIS